MVKKRTIASTFSAVAWLAVLLTCNTYAQTSTRTWVSGVGDDVNPCSRTAPCKTFAGAISKTTPGGEINTLDPGGFGGVTITFAVSIIDDYSGVGGVLVAGSNGIVVQVGPNDVVNLKGLTFDGSVGTGLNGISFQSGGTLTVEKCTFFNFGGDGIHIIPTATGATVNVIDSVIQNNKGSGILIQPGSGGNATVNLNGVRALGNTNYGIEINGTNAGAISSLNVKNSLVSNNAISGLYSTSSGAPLSVMVDTSTFSGNVMNGVLSDSAQSTVRLGRSTVTGNGTGLNVTNGGVLASYGNNNVAGNTSDGTASTTIAVK